MSEKALLIELGCEEIPASLVRGLSEALANGILRALQESGLVEKDATFKVFGTPRRLAVLVDRVAAKQDTQTIERRGPAIAAAFDEAGQPTKAALGFAQSVGKQVEDLDRLSTEQGQWLAATIEQPGKSLEELVQDTLHVVIKDMASAKSMRWQDDQQRFIRPVRWLVAMHDALVLPISLFGLTANNTTYGHRVHSKGEVSLPQASDYEQSLMDSFVMVDIEKRKQTIIDQVEALASNHGFVADERTLDGLVEENTQLTEWPQAVLGSFDTTFLSVPEPALISAMELHQKCFALRDQSGRLSHHFIAIANIESTDPKAMTHGFERVIRPRLSDAQFFWNQDQQTPLLGRCEALDDVLFQKDLGSLGQKTKRLEMSVATFSPLLGVDVAIATKAARLAKCDLLTEMVGEFPELQGTMGYHLALKENLEPQIANALEQHYWPRAAGDRLPSDSVGVALALADRADTLLGIFGVGLKPKGSKDPFALRRAALAVVRLLELQPSMGLEFVLQQAIKPLAEQLVWSEAHCEQVIDEVFGFCLERARSHAQDQGIQTLTFQAVTAAPVTSVADLMARARAVEGLLSHPQIDRLIEANKRLTNLLAKQQAKEEKEVDPKLFEEAEEKALFDVWEIQKGLVKNHVAEGDYEQALAGLASLAGPLDDYFEKVMVMAEDERIRTNRLALLGQMRNAFFAIADFTKLGR